MTTIYDYPKSSCDCYDCYECYNCAHGMKQSHEISNQYPSNMSISGCKIPKLFDCYDRTPISYNIEPTDEKGYFNLNPQAISEKYSHDFQKVKCDGKQSCPITQYASKDPRLVSVSHSGQVQTLDKPPIQSDIPLDKIAHDESLNRYGQRYNTYSDINAGQIMYYVDKSIADPFFLPVFATSAGVQGTLYRDPMGAFKPQYDREPLKCNDRLNTQKTSYDGCLSWIQDSQEYRENLVASQMRKMNEQRWTPRWNSNQ